MLGGTVRAPDRSANFPAREVCSNMMSMSFKPAAGPSAELPEVDERLAEPETRFEVEDGRWVYVAPADEPHGEGHATVGALVKSHHADGYSIAIDMLTRTSRTDDIAPDVSVYPSARNPRSGARQLEELAFEVVSAQSLAHVGQRAAKLVARGVRRVFALDVKRMR
ncbi:MAG TPA: Uma2 family endonuclease, partial [Kofleriaceae bacterium]|nr:Uma2 family endonuclease [Kofleriaceae bacterium]